MTGERCNFTGEYCERGSMSKEKIVIGYRTLAGEFCVVSGECPLLCKNENQNLFPMYLKVLPGLRRL